MKIKDTLQRDPATHALVNQGQARISDGLSERTQAELRGELEMFVCEGQYADGIHKIIHSFLDNLSRTSQRGAWVSGFYGSGKSHLLKMLCHLWQDTTFSDGSTARGLVPSIPEDLRTLLRELDTAGKRAGGLVAAAGALPSGTTDNVRLTILAILLRALGLPDQYAQARFCLWLRSQGHYNAVKDAVEAEGKSFQKELNNLYVSGPVARAVMACDQDFAASERDAKQLLKAQFPPQVSDITTDEFLRTAREALRFHGKDGRLPCVVLILDEVQQYVGESTERSVLVTEVAEAVSKQLDSHVIIVGAGQSALTDAPLLQKLMDRFTIRVSLSDTDVETVTRKVLLQKRPASIPNVRAMFGRYAGEVSRQLQGTRIAETARDDITIVDDYPLLPVRRRFWESCFRQIDAAGTNSQLRSQLRILHDAIAKISERHLGTLIPADELFESLAPEMVNTGVLLREINERIIQVGNTNGKLAQRICGLIFLVGKLRREAGIDIGVRATKEHLSDLLIDDVSVDNGKFRSEVGEQLTALSEQGVLMPVEDEFRLQTREGSEWDREFRNQQTRLNGDAAAVQFRRDQLLYGTIETILRTLRVTQGDAREPRQFLVHRDQNPPPLDGSSVPIWIRDGWSCGEKEVLDAARSAGVESPVVYIFIPRQSAEDLRRLIVESEATQRAIGTKGRPTTSEGQEAQQSMISRNTRAVSERDELVREIIANSKVFQGGGSEILLASLDLRIKTATEAALVRLFPRFKEADSGVWESVIKRARDGADNPFQPTGYSGATERHPVCQQVISIIGNGKSGSEIRKSLGATPFGWPRDAVDAALIVLHRIQHVTAILNGQPILPGQLDQNKISKAEFRVEQVTLSVSDRLELRKLFQELNIPPRNVEDSLRADEFLNSLITLATSTGGPSPLPPPPSTREIEEVRRLVGNEKLAAIKEKALAWTEEIKLWVVARDLIARRLPVWGVVVRLARHAALLPEAQPQLEQVAAIEDQRLLLESSDPANSVRLGLSRLLRNEIQSACTARQEAYNAAVTALRSSEIWQKLTDEDRAHITSVVGLVPPKSPEFSTDEALADALDMQPLVAIRAEVDATSARASQAIERAARLLEPTVQTIKLERSTLKNPDEVRSWIERQQSKLLEAVSNGPVLVD